MGVYDQMISSSDFPLGTDRLIDLYFGWTRYLTEDEWSYWTATIKLNFIIQAVMLLPSPSWGRVEPSVAMQIKEYVKFSSAG